MNHQTSTVSQVIPQVAYQSPQAPTQLITESLFIDLGFDVPVFSLGDDLIASWYKEKAMLAEAQEAGQILDEEQLAFLADLGIPAEVLMANISNYGSDDILEVPNSETYLNDMDNQSVHALQDFEQLPVMDFTDNEISSDSNIIPYSQYL
ncbi:hypothetical protein Tco_0043671 [Tanacetum coccineum]